MRYGGGVWWSTVGCELERSVEGCGEVSRGMVVGAICVITYNYLLKKSFLFYDCLQTVISSYSTGFFWM